MFAVVGDTRPPNIDDTANYPTAIITKIYQDIINSHPLTLLIVGHTHEYRHESYDKEVIVGNGGAPLTSGTNYGYVMVSRNSDGTLKVTCYDYQTHAVLDTFQIQASGAGA